VAASDLECARRFYEEGLGLAPASRGVTFEQYDQSGLAADARGVFEGPGFRAAWVKDPDGNALAITQDLG
jgi:catechol 2,3-dioxygenase-like lactoylglutathione lyase family enzyme